MKLVLLIGFMVNGMDEKIYHFQNLDEGHLNKKKYFFFILHESDQVNYEKNCFGLFGYPQINRRL